MNDNAPSNRARYGHLYPDGTRKVYADVYMDDKDARFRLTVAEKGYGKALEYLEYSVRKVIYND